MKNLKINNKLFYGKWPYKVEGTLVGSYAAIRFSDREFARWRVTEQPSSDYWPPRKIPDRQEVADFKEILDVLKGTMDLQYRAESSTFCIYCLDKASAESIAIILKKWVHTIYEPVDDAALTFMQTNSPKKLLVDKLPYDKFKYKVWLIANASPDLKERFFKWSLSYPEKLLISKATKAWLVGLGRRWYAAPFLYVENAATMTLVNLYLGTNIKKTEEFILKSSINTPSGP